jgi:hypothetical protein
VTPSPETLNQTYAAFRRGALARRVLEAQLEQLNAEPVDVPDDLEDRVRAHFEENPTDTWDAAVRATMNADERVHAYLVEHPEATWDDAVRAVGEAQ